MKVKAGAFAKEEKNFHRMVEVSGIQVKTNARTKPNFQDKVRVGSLQVLIFAS